jgi:ATP-binding cassette, subfamily C (CFTR/MRP), member 1
VGDVGSGKSSLLLSIVGDLLYASPEFASKFRNNSYWSNKELKSALLSHSQKPIPEDETPVLISERMALVQQTPFI